MLILKPQIKIFTKKVTLQNGADALAYFAVMEVGGTMECKFLGTKQIIDTKPRILLLEEPRKIIFGESPIRTMYEIFSPYFTLDFLVNQMARAPSVR